MSFKDTTAISGAVLADNTNLGINEVDKYNLWENAHVTRDDADEKNSAVGSKVMMVTGFAGTIVASVLLGGKIFGVEQFDKEAFDEATKAAQDVINKGGTAELPVPSNYMKKVNPGEVKTAIGIIIAACCVLIIAGFISQMKSSARDNQLADDINKTAIENQKSLQEQAKRMTARHKASTSTDIKLYDRKSDLIGKSLTNMVASQADATIAESKRRGIDLLKELNSLQDSESLSNNIKNLESVNSSKASIEKNGFIYGNGF